MYLTQGLQRCVQQSPDRTATQFRTFRELGCRVVRLGSVLRGLKVRSGRYVSMLALNSGRCIEYVLGMWWGGDVLNLFNIRWSVPEIVYSLGDCNTGILIVDDHFLALASSIVVTAKRTPVPIYAGENTTPDGIFGFESLIESAKPVADAFRGGNGVADIMYIGGTGGKPKGVMQSYLILWSSLVGHVAKFLESNSVCGGVAAHSVAASRPGNNVTGNDLHEYCRQFIVTYKCLKSIEFRTELPLSAVGKLLKRGFRMLYWQNQTQQIS